MLGLPQFVFDEQPWQFKINENKIIALGLRVSGQGWFITLFQIAGS